MTTSIYCYTYEEESLTIVGFMSSTNHSQDETCFHEIKTKLEPIDALSKLDDILIYHHWHHIKNQDNLNWSYYLSSYELPCFKRVISSIEHI